MIFLRVLKHRILKDEFTLGMSTQSLGFITMVVGFLVISRVSMALSRYNSARDSLGMYLFALFSMENNFSGGD